MSPTTKEKILRLLVVIGAVFVLACLALMVIEWAWDHGSNASGIWGLVQESRKRGVREMLVLLGILFCVMGLIAALAPKSLLHHPIALRLGVRAPESEPLAVDNKVAESLPPPIAEVAPPPQSSEPAKKQWIGHPIKEIHRPQQMFSVQRTDRAGYLSHLLSPRIIGTKAQAYYKSGWFGLPTMSRHTEYTVTDVQPAGDILRVKVAEPILSDSGDPCETLALLYGFDGDDGTVGITGDAHLAITVTENRLRAVSEVQFTAQRFLEVRFTMRPATPINVARVRLEWSPPGHVQTHGDRLDVRAEPVKQITPCRLDLPKDESAEFLLSYSAIGGDGRIVVTAGGNEWVSDWFVISRVLDNTPRP